MSATEAHKPGLYCEECGEKWPCPTIPSESICGSCKNVIEPGTTHEPFNGNQMYVCAIVRT